MKISYIIAAILFGLCGFLYAKDAYDNHSSTRKDLCENISRAILMFTACFLFVLRNLFILNKEVALVVIAISCLIIALIYLFNKKVKLAIIPEISCIGLLIFSTII